MPAEIEKIEPLAFVPVFKMPKFTEKLRHISRSHERDRISFEPDSVISA